MGWAIYFVVGLSAASPLRVWLNASHIVHPLHLERHAKHPHTHSPTHLRVFRPPRRHCFALRPCERSRPHEPLTFDFVFAGRGPRRAPFPARAPPALRLGKVSLDAPVSRAVYALVYHTRRQHRLSRRRC